MKGSLVAPIASFVHFARGARSLGLASLGVLILTSLSTALPQIVIPVLAGFVIVPLVIGLSTLPRDGATAQANLTATLEKPDLMRRLTRLLVVPGVLLILLLPQLFLGAYGIPHMTPLTGLVLPSVQRQLGLIYLAFILILPLVALRQARHSMGASKTRRPKDVPEEDPMHDRRDLLILCSLAIAVVWLIMLRSFWSPFSLFAWPPSFASLYSVRAVTAVAFTVAPPIVLFMRIALHAELARLMLRDKDTERRARRLALNGLHLLLLIGCVALHAYNLFWIARYQAASSQ
jgi:hypothetical protein